jgi:glycosyltransferase involved in cell wall biosynthesis
MPGASGRTVAFFMPSFRGGGAERVMLTVASGLVRDVSVDIVVAQKEGPYLTQVPAGVRIVDLAAHRVIAGIPALCGYLRRERPYAMLSALTHVNVVAVWTRVLARVATRLVISEHTTATASAEHAASMRERVLPAFARLSYGKADAIVAVSAGAAADLAALTGLDPSRITVIHNPVVTPAVLALASRPLEHPWFRQGQPPVILGAGRLTASKDFQTLIRAFALVRSQRDARLVILGEGEERAMLQRLVRELGIERDCMLPGFVDNPYQYMRHAAVFVLSSRWEGFGNVLAEAMACGCPVVSTDCPNGPREILEDGRYGRLVPVRDADALARAIHATLEQRPDADSVERAMAFGLDTALEKYRRALAL